MENRWTTSQLQAIETVDRDVSVSAGAGSGKTGVLAERYLRIVRRSLAGELPESQSAGIGQILVITFTEKATREMKSRIAESLTRAGLSPERRELENAYISTFHAFCSRLLKENPFEAGVDPEFTVLEESESRRLIRQAFDSALDYAFVQEDEELIELASSAQNERRRDKDARDSMAVLCSEVESALGKLRGAGWREDGLCRVLEAGVDSLGMEALKSVAAWTSPYIVQLVALRDELKRLSRGTIGNLENKRQLALNALRELAIPESWDEVANVSAAVCAGAKALSGTLKPRKTAPVDDYRISEILEGVKSTFKELEFLRAFDAEREKEALQNGFSFLKLTLRAWEFYSLAKHEQGVVDSEDLTCEAVHLL
jgi:ATP-dependent helicase/nuclease subunit A